LPSGCSTPMVGLLHVCLHTSKNVRYTANRHGAADGRLRDRGWTSSELYKSNVEVEQTEGLEARCQMPIIDCCCPRGDSGQGKARLLASDSVSPVDL
ncbi:hypothetical protein FOZ63_012055, partial [Perkinsus olseni]